MGRADRSASIALVAFPILMARRPNPLVPLGLFRRRAFATINLSTLLIYGALYTIFVHPGPVPAGRRSATARRSRASSGCRPGILLTVLSTRVGTLSGRLGARRFLVGGPARHGGGLLWWLRVPATTEPWVATLSDPSTVIPPLDVLPTPCPRRDPLRHRDLAARRAADDGAHELGAGAQRRPRVGDQQRRQRIGQPLLSAVIFIVVISGSFYATLASSVPGLDPEDPALRAQVQPLNPAAPGTPPEVAAAATEASVDAMRLASLVCAALLAGGAAANGIGLRSRSGEGAAGEGAPDRPASQEAVSVG